MTASSEVVTLMIHDLKFFQILFYRSCNYGREGEPNDYNDDGTYSWMSVLGEMRIDWPGDLYFRCEVRVKHRKGYRGDQTSLVATFPPDLEKKRPPEPMAKHLDMLTRIITEDEAWVCFFYPLHGTSTEHSLLEQIITSAGESHKPEEQGPLVINVVIADNDWVQVMRIVCTFNGSEPDKITVTFDGDVNNNPLYKRDLHGVIQNIPSWLNCRGVQLEYPDEIEASTKRNRSGDRGEPNDATKLAARYQAVHTLLNGHSANGAYRTSEQTARNVWHQVLTIFVAPTMVKDKHVKCNECKKEWAIAGIFPQENDEFTFFCSHVGAVCAMNRFDQGIRVHMKEKRRRDSGGRPQLHQRRKIRRITSPTSPGPTFAEQIERAGDDDLDGSLGDDLGDDLGDVGEDHFMNDVLDMDFEKLVGSDKREQMKPVVSAIVRHVNENGTGIFEQCCTHQEPLYAMLCDSNDPASYLVGPGIRAFRKKNVEKTFGGNYKEATLFNAQGFGQKCFVAQPFADTKCCAGSMCGVVNSSIVNDAGDFEATVKPCIFCHLCVCSDKCMTDGICNDCMSRYFCGLGSRCSQGHHISPSPIVNIGNQGDIRKIQCGQCNFCHRTVCNSSGCLAILEGPMPGQRRAACSQCLREMMKCGPCGACQTSLQALPPPQQNIKYLKVMECKTCPTLFLENCQKAKGWPSRCICPDTNCLSYAPKTIADQGCPLCPLCPVFNEEERIKHMGLFWQNPTYMIPKAFERHTKASACTKAWFCSLVKQYRGRIMKDRDIHDLTANVVFSALEVYNKKRTPTGSQTVYFFFNPCEMDTASKMVSMLDALKTEVYQAACTKFYNQRKDEKSDNAGWPESYNVDPINNVLRANYTRCQYRTDDSPVTMLSYLLPFATAAAIKRIDTVRDVIHSDDFHLKTVTNPKVIVFNDMMRLLTNPRPFEEGDASTNIFCTQEAWKASTNDASMFPSTEEPLYVAGHKGYVPRRKGKAKSEPDHKCEVTTHPVPGLAQLVLNPTLPLQPNQWTAARSALQIERANQAGRFGITDNEAGRFDETVVVQPRDITNLTCAVVNLLMCIGTALLGNVYGFGINMSTSLDNNPFFVCEKLSCLHSKLIFLPFCSDNDCSIVVIVNASAVLQGGAFMVYFNPKPKSGRNFDTTIKPVVTSWLDRQYRITSEAFHQQEAFTENLEVVVPGALPTTTQNWLTTETDSAIAACCLFTIEMFRSAHREDVLTKEFYTDLQKKGFEITSDEAKKFKQEILPQLYTALGGKGGAGPALSTLAGTQHSDAYPLAEPTAGGSDQSGVSI